MWLSVSAEQQPSHWHGPLQQPQLGPPDIGAPYPLQLAANSGETPGGITTTAPPGAAVGAEGIGVGGGSVMLGALTAASGPAGIGWGAIVAGRATAIVAAGFSSRKPAWRTA